LGSTAGALAGIAKFFAEGNSDLKYWFGLESPHDLNRLCVFAKTGGDGSRAAFWINPQGKQRIVHLGSGSGSIMICVLADDAVDFLRLLAIGYDEICWNEGFSEPPNSGAPGNELTVHPNMAFQEWVREIFKVDIPRTALEIVKHPADMGDTDSRDEFWRWVTEHASE
jgi:hypothetical protein